VSISQNMPDKFEMLNVAKYAVERPWLLVFHFWCFWPVLSCLPWSRAVQPMFWWLCTTQCSDSWRETLVGYRQYPRACVDERDLGFTHGLQGNETISIYFWWWQVCQLVCIHPIRVPKNVGKKQPRHLHRKATLHGQPFGMDAAPWVGEGDNMGSQCMNASHRGRNLDETRPKHW
jgi:hypothetical protein